MLRPAHPRSLLYVSPRACPSDLEAQLKNRDWELVQVRSFKAALPVLKRQQLRVALLALDTVPPELDEEFNACLAECSSCEWIGIFPPAATQAQPLCQLVLSHFFDYHTKPVDPTFLLQCVGHAFGRAELRVRSSNPSGLDAGDDELGLVGRSPAIERLRRMIRRAGPTDVPVLIGGESGSGKELVAKALHACSLRAHGPFVAVNCGALPPTLIHSELFGHERGSFSGASSQRRGLIETSRGGTLFLDEIAELPLDLQATLLRFLQEKTIQRVGSVEPLSTDTRVIAASHVDLTAAVAAGRFREDLFYRLNVLHLVVPPLRERREDIPLLARHFHELCVQKAGAKVKGFSPMAMDALCAHDWPGNVRELFNRVQRSVVMAENALISPAVLGLAPAASRKRESLQSIRLQAEMDAIRFSLQSSGHNVTMAARELGISRMTLYRLMAKHRISLQESVSAPVRLPTTKRHGTDALIHVGHSGGPSQVPLEWAAVPLRSATA